MIIARQYVKLGELFENDERAKEVFIKAQQNAMLEQEDIDEILSWNIDYDLFHCEFGCGIRNIDKIRNAFEKLDKVDPYDNGLSFKNVYDIEIIDKDEYSIHYLLKTADGRIIQEIKNEVYEFEYLEVMRLSEIFVPNDFHVEVKNNNNTILYKKYYSDTWRILPEEKVADFLNGLSCFHIERWKDNYRREEAEIYDGASWSVKYQTRSNINKHISISTAIPNNWNEFMNFIKKTFNIYEDKEHE